MPNAHSILANATRSDRSVNLHLSVATRSVATRSVATRSVAVGFGPELVSPRLSQRPYTVTECWHIVCVECQDMYDFGYGLGYGLGERNNPNIIGLTLNVTNEYDDIVLCIDVLMTADVFYRFPIQTAKQYLRELAEMDENAIVFAADLESELHIYGLHDVYDFPNILKTCWIRILQRKWRRMYAKRMREWRLLGTLKAQRHFELTGNYRHQYSWI